MSVKNPDSKQTLWVPLEVSSLRSKAHEQAQANQDKHKDSPNSRLRSELGVELGTELLAQYNAHTQDGFLTDQKPCRSIDEVLQACIKPGLISLAAEDGTDRSTLSLYIAVDFLLQSQTNVSFIDSTGSFDVTKTLQALQHRLGEDAEGDKKPSPYQIAMLDRVAVSRVFDLEGLNQTVLELNNQLKVAKAVEGLGMVIIDNMASVIMPEINKDRTHGYAELEKASLRLRKLAMQHHIVVVLLNSLTRSPGVEDIESNNASPVPLLGRNFADLLDSSLLMLSTGRSTSQNRAESNSSYSLKVLKDHMGIGTDQTIIFKFENGYKLTSLS